MRKALTLILAIVLTTALTTVALAETETELTIIDVDNPDVQVLSFRDTEGVYKEASFSLEGTGSATGAIVAESRGPSGNSAPDVNKVVKVEGGFTGESGNLESTFSSYAMSKYAGREIFNSNIVDAEGVTDGSMTVFGRATAWESGTPGPYGSIKNSSSSQSFSGEAEEVTIESHRNSNNYAFTPPAANLSVDVVPGNSEEEIVGFSGGTISGVTGVWGGSRGLSYTVSGESDIMAQPTTSYSYTRHQQDSDWVWGKTSSGASSTLELPGFEDYEVPGFSFEPSEE